MEIINVDNLEKMHKKIDDLLDKENLSVAETKFVLQDLLNRNKWIDQEEKFDNLTKQIKKAKK